MTTFPKVSRIIVVNCVARNMTIDREMNPPVNVLVSASLLNLKNCMEAKRSNFLRSSFPTETALDMNKLIITHSDDSYHLQIKEIVFILFNSEQLPSVLSAINCSMMYWILLSNYLIFYSRKIFSSSKRKQTKITIS